MHISFGLLQLENATLTRCLRYEYLVNKTQRFSVVPQICSDFSIQTYEYLTRSLPEFNCVVAHEILREFFTQ